MIEMAIIAMIVSSVTLRVAGNVAVDAGFAMRGLESPRYARAKARRTPGAASRYWGQLWDDAWAGASTKHAERRANPSPRSRGAASVFLSNLWRDGWVSAERKRQEKASRPRPGQQTVPGTVVPNTEDGPEPRSATVPDKDETAVPDFMCLSCEKRPALPSKLWCAACRPSGEDAQPEPTDQQDDPESIPDSDRTEPTTPKGTTMTTTMPTDTEVVSLNKAIDYSESTARMATEMINSLDVSQSNLAAGGVTGIAIESFSSAKESFGTIAAAMETAAVEFKAHLAVQEARIANPGAGSDEFIMGGR